MIGFASEHSTSDIAYSKEDETVTLTFPSPLPVGNGNLSMEFTGELNDKMKGFYRGKYTDEDGKDRYCAVTQFEVSFNQQFLFVTILRWQRQRNLDGVGKNMYPSQSFDIACKYVVVCFA